MSRPDVLIVDGRAFSWRRLCDLRRQQLETLRAAQAEQLTLFALRDDHRPNTACTAAGRYREPSLLDWEPED